MSISSRVQMLRRISIDTPAVLSSERAELVTRFYQQQQDLISAPVFRALVFKYLMENKTICIYDGELIVGEKGPEPKAAPTYPELCCHSIKDLNLLNDREKIPFRVEPRDLQIYTEQIIPFWKGRSMRELIFRQMDPEWIAAYEAGIFTEFMEQRAPGHTVLDEKIYRKGMLDFIADIDVAINGLDYLGDPYAYDRLEELTGMRICAKAIIRFAERHADLADQLAISEINPLRKFELNRIASICRWVPAHAPRDLWEALQYYWFVHLGVTTELNTWDSFSPGRLDQHLEPFYLQGIKNGTLTRSEAEELLQCFWIKFNNQPAPPKVGVTAAESGTYTDFAQINIGGLKADGSDGVNEVSYLLLDVVEEMRLLQPSASIQISKKNPDQFINSSLDKK